MMFETLSENLQNAIHKIKGYGKITENNIAEMLREVRLALLEADVNYQVVKEFTNKVKEQALGEEVQRSIKPGDLFVKIVKDELVNLLGKETKALNLKGQPAVLMLVGLQGSGKTTTIAKLANFIRKKYHKRPLMLAADIYRPAAIQQLQQLGRELNIDVYSENSKDVAIIANNAIKYAQENNYDYVLIDTAGRLHIEDELMQELREIKEKVNPQEILLVIDAMIGQDAINVINGFNEKLPLTGVVLTKLDGDTKGGVALSARQLTNVPIKFVGISEKLDGLELFNPERMASRIIGMGDVISLVEKASEIIDEKETLSAAKRLKSGKFDLEDFLVQMKQIK
ncbi:MAG: signal recognition particle protein, partial [Tenericutes bacterium]|nr:signal recognition particle protein [Mycoplasmatota bacterium]